MMKLDLSGQVAVVTGGSSGIGLAAALLLLGAGASVGICGRNWERLKSAEASLAQACADGDDRRLLVQRCDVLNQEDVKSFAEAMRARFGRVDMLINNAGQGRVSTFSSTLDEEWREELELKYFGVIRPTRAFLPMLQASPNPSIVCVNSLLALQPERHMVATSSARAGLLNLTKSLANELAGDGIRVNSILIGIVESGQWRRRFQSQAQDEQSWDEWTAAIAREKEIPLGRFGRPEEAAKAIFFLATSLSSYTTGSHIDVSGGVARHV
ncbi:SDR family oxidoreductase [Caballeronia novacaledonica]|uniref:SDR family oxidoreductase n=1 Tax=Caballeronia novacaledonica TaxID=1544861 RepID=A0ACB5R5X3_9BURK|nr:SDR family oxidoreductase [Caballeronia sp. NK8]GJH22754.1 SDR family oxidoreductase [Caballeronia novacaledonica]